MLIVGLTGNVASGKSAVAALWRDAGVPVVSSDELARQVVEPGTQGLEEVRRALGDEVLAPDGTLDRGAVRERVFSDERARRVLEGILHPRIRHLQAEWIEAREAEGAEMVVAEIPLLFEVGREDDVDLTVLVDAPPEVRLERMVRDRGLEPAAARRIMEAQMDSGEKRRRADLVVENDGTLEELREKAMATLDALRARATTSGSQGPRDPDAPSPADPGAAS